MMLHIPESMVETQRDRSPLAPNVRGQRVVLYTSSDCWRGAGVSFVNIARGLDRHGFVPQVLSMCPEVTEEFRNAGVAVAEVPRGDREAWRLHRFLRASNACAVIVDRAHDLRVGALAVVATRAALINRYNHFRPKPPTDILVRAAYRTVVRELVFLSSTAREHVLRDVGFMRGVPSTTIYEGIDVGQFRQCPAAAATFRAEFEIGCEPFLLAVGALAPEKRYDVLFDAVAQMGESAPLLVVCGEGPEEPQLLRRVEALGIRVRFLGRIAQSDLLGAYNAALALIHVGDVETFGLAVLEAMACARPVIVAHGGALPEVVGTDGECGTLVPIDSTGRLQQAVRRVTSHPDEAARMGRRARERARTRFSVEAMEDAYAALVARHALVSATSKPASRELARR